MDGQQWALLGSMSLSTKTLDFTLHRISFDYLFTEKFILFQNIRTLVAITINSKLQTYPFLPQYSPISLTTAVKYCQTQLYHRKTLPCFVTIDYWPLFTNTSTHSFNTIPSSRNQIRCSPPLDSNSHPRPGPTDCPCPTPSPHLPASHSCSRSHCLK